MDDRAPRTPYALCALVGLGRTLIGVVLALDNVITFLLVPWSGTLSDRLRARGRGRLPIVLAGLVLAAAGMAVLPSSPGLGLAGLLGAMVVLYSGINLMRAPFQALVADLVPSRFRPLATGSVTFQMCVGAIVFLMLGRALGVRVAFLVAGATVLAIALAFAIGVREKPGAGGTATEEETTFRALLAALGAVVRAGRSASAASRRA
jgi:hypothetical protein